MFIYLLYIYLFIFMLYVFLSSYMWEKTAGCERRESFLCVLQWMFNLGNGAHMATWWKECCFSILPPSSQGQLTSLPKEASPCQPRWLQTITLICLAAVPAACMFLVILLDGITVTYEINWRWTLLTSLLLPYVSPNLFD